MDAEKTNQIVAKMNRGTDRKDEVMMSIDPYCNWEKFIMPAPTSIAILGQLMAIACKTDFSLTERTPEGGFQFLKQPSSFRACLVQISNEGCSAFMKAHKNMDKIRLYTSQFEGNVGEAVKVLLKGTDADKAMLPAIFNEMKADAKKCLELAMDTENSFENVMCILNETSETSTAVKRLYEEKYKQNEVKICTLTQREQRTKERLEKLEIERKKILERLGNARAAHEKSIDDMPGVGKILMCNVVEDSMKIVSDAVNVFSLHKLTKTVGGAAVALSGKVKSKFTKSKTKESITTGSQEDPTFSTEDDIEVKQVAFDVEHVDMILACIENVFEMFEEAPEDSMETDQAEVGVKMDKVRGEIGFPQTQLEEVLGDFKSSKYKDKKIVKDAIIICARGIAICKELRACSTSLQASSTDKNRNLFERTEKLLTLANGYRKAAQSFHGQNMSTATPSGLEKAKTRQGRMSAAELATENAKYAVEEKKKLYELALKEQQQAQEKQLECEEKMDQTLEELRQTDLDKINFEQIQITLKKGIIALSELKEQWANLILFFAKVTNIIDVCIEQKTGKMEDRLNAVGYTLSSMTRDMILDMAASVSAVANATHVVADTYVTISTNHLIGNTAALVKLVAYNVDDEDDMKALDRERNALQANCAEAHAEIKSLADKRREEASALIERKRQRIEVEIEPALPQLPEEKATFITEVVRSGGMPLIEDEADETLEDYL